VRGLQATELHHDEEPAERPGAHRAHQVLPLGPPPHAAQGDPLTRRPPAPQVGDDVGALALRARDGDRQALEPLVRATYADAYGLALRLVGDEHDARDAVQEAYLRVLHSIRRFRGEAAFTTWLHRIIANCAADLLARRSRVGRHELAAADVEEVGPAAAPLVPVDLRPEHDPVRQSERQADRQRLQAALAALPERLRLVVVLHDVYDLPHDAIAAELGITVAAAKVRLHRARRRLRDDLFDHGVEQVAGAGLPRSDAGAQRPSGTRRAVPRAGFGPSAGEVASAAG